ncbi:MAG: hypothetical protein AAFO69_18860 [Bacteroidota bacterium]
MINRLYSILAIFLSFFSATYLSYIYGFAFYAVRNEVTDNGLNPYSIGVANVLWPSVLASLFSLICCWIAYKKRQELRLLALILAFLVLLATIFFQQLLALALTFFL